MTRLSYVKTDSYVSLAELEEEEKVPHVDPPVFVFGVDHQGVYLRHRDNEDRGDIFVERRINCGEVTSLLRLESSVENTSNYVIILDTNHQAFNKARSSTARNLKSFYYLSSILKVSKNQFQELTLDLSLILETSSILLSAFSTSAYVDVLIKQSTEIVTFVFISC